MNLLLSAIIYLAAFLALIIGILAILKNRSFLNISFTIFAWLTAYWIVTNILITLQPYTFWVRNCYAAGALLAPSALVWILVLINDRKNKYKILLIYLSGAIFFILGYTDFIIKNAEKTFIGGFEGTFGKGFNIFSFYSIFLIFWILGKLYLTYKKSSGILKLQLKYVMYGMYGFGITTGTLNFLLPLFGIETFIPLDSPSSVFFIAASGYAMIRYRLFDIRIFLRKIFVVGGALVFTVIISLFIIYGNLAYGKIVPESIMGPVALIAGIVLFQYLRKWFLKLANRYFFTSLYDPQEITERVGRDLAQTLELNQIITTIVKTMKQALGTERYTFVLCKEKDQQTHGYCTVKKTAGMKHQDITELLKNDSLYQFLTEYKDILVREEIEDLTQKTAKKYVAPLLICKKELTQLKIAVLVPIISHKKIIALIFFGDKLSHDAFTLEDLRLLRNIANQASIAMVNAQLYEETKKFNALLQIEVTKATQNLTKTNTHLKKLLKIRSEFLDIASHQLRTPVSVINGTLSMLRDGDLDRLPKEKHKEFIENAYTKGKKLDFIINDILAASEMDAENFGFVLQDVIDPVEFLEKVVKEFLLEAEKKQLKLIFEQPSKSIPKILTNIKYLEQAVGNLISNALRYTAKGKIQVSVKTESSKNQTVIISVEDTGIGIPKADLPKLFDKFMRAKNAIDMYTDGSGLGLFIVKQIMENHPGGKVSVESVENKGSIFSIQLPAAKTKVNGANAITKHPSSQS